VTKDDIATRQLHCRDAVVNAALSIRQALGSIRYRLKDKLAAGWGYISCSRPYEVRAARGHGSDPAKEVLFGREIVQCRMPSVQGADNI